MMRRLSKLTLVIVMLASCNKSYEYVEVIEEDTIVSGAVKKEKDPKNISAPNDSAAYMEAFKTFHIAVKINNDMKSALGKTYTTPISFKLLNSNGDDITNSVAFTDKDKVEKEILDRIYAMENSIQKAVDNNKKSKLENFKSNVKVDSLAVNRLIKNFRQKKDEFSNNNRVWFEHKNSPQYINQNGLYCYFQTENGIPSNLRIRYQYYGDEWVFFNKVQFSIDGKAYEYIPSDTKTDSGDGKIWEWFDESLYQEDKELINALTNAHNAKLRITGSTRFDIKNISKSEIDGIKQTLDLFYALGGQY